MSKRPDYTVPEEPSAESLAEIPELPDEAWDNAVRGLDAARAKWGRVRIDPELRKLFPTEKDVNDALRKVAELVQQVEARRG
jgi:hypothetical protein